jgi:hypothetical protein
MRIEKRVLFISVDRWHKRVSVLGVQDVAVLVFQLQNESLALLPQIYSEVFVVFL